MNFKTEKIIIVSMFFSTIMVNYSCEKGINYIQSERKYIIENNAHLELKGKYHNVDLSDEFDLVFSKKHIISYDSYFVMFGDMPRDTIPCKRIGFTLYSQDFMSELEADIRFNSDYKSTNYNFRLCKIYDSNRWLYIMGSNSVLLDVNPDNMIDTLRMEDIPWKEYKIEDFQFNDDNGIMQFSMHVHYNSDSLTDYYLDGLINLHYYSQENFYK